MTFQEQYEAALTIKTAQPSEHIPEAAYYAGSFYSLSETAAAQLPTVLSGGSVTVEPSVTLSFGPLTCRMLICTLEGAGTLRLSGKEQALPTGSLLYLDCRKLSFSLTASRSPWRIITFSLGGGLFPVYEALVPFKSFLLLQTDAYSPIRRELYQLLAGSTGAALENKLRDAGHITAILTELFVNAIPPEKQDGLCAPYLAELKHYIDNHLTAHIQLSDLERRCHRNKYRICHEFSAAFGLPPLKYLNKKRMEAAETLLLSTQKKIHEIALEIGYENTNHFIHLFKKEYGATPQAYREAHLH